MKAQVFRTALVASGALAASAFGVTFAGAQQANTVAQVNFNDPNAELGEGSSLNLSVQNDANQRFAPIGPKIDQPSHERTGEVELAAGGGNAPLDISIAQRASLGSDSNGDINRRGSGSELRVGRGLVAERDSNGRGSSTYIFVASEDEALTWTPGARNEFGGDGPSFALQDRVEVGDISAGVTWERNGVQTSLAYVEREASTRVGNESYSQDTSFTGVTVTLRR